MLFAEMKSETAIRCGVATADPSYAYFANLVNAGLRAVELAHPNGWSWMRATGDMTLIAGQEQYTFAAIQSALSLPTLPAKIHEVRLTVPLSPAVQRQPLKRVSRTEADTQYPITATQCPQVWWVEGQALGFRPVPDLAYSVRVTVVQSEKKLVGDTDAPILPARFHDVPLEKAAELWFRRVRNAGDAQVAAAAFNAGLTMLRQSNREFTGAGRVHVENDDWG